MMSELRLKGRQVLTGKSQRGAFQVQETDAMVQWFVEAKSGCEPGKMWLCVGQDKAGVMGRFP